MPLTPNERAARARDRMLETVKAKGVKAYSTQLVAPEFQRMIRAEFAAIEWPFAYAIIDGVLTKVGRQVGQCACVTCGKIDRWDGKMQTGHFIGSRRNSILYQEENVAPQCVSCNFWLSGNPQQYRRWMLEMRGEECVERLERLKTESVKFTADELVDMKIGYTKRLKAAIEKMQNSI